MQLPSNCGEPLWARTYRFELTTSGLRSSLPSLATKDRALLLHIPCLGPVRVEAFSVLGDSPASPRQQNSFGAQRSELSLPSASLAVEGPRDPRRCGAL